MATNGDVQKTVDHLKNLCTILDASVIQQIVNGYKQVGEMERNQKPNIIYLPFKATGGTEKTIIFMLRQNDQTNMLRILTEDFEVPSAYVGDIDNLLRCKYLESKIRTYEETLEEMQKRKSSPTILPYEHEEIFPEDKVTTSEKER
jgi:hydrogenase maturation factor HypF (carbamoyltransferase family)